MTNTFLNFENCGFKKDALEKEAQKLFGYIEQLKKLDNDFSYSRPESFISLANDKELIKKVKSLIEKKKEKDLELVVLVGIGGSSLGALALNKALLKEKKIIFAQTVDAQQIKKIIKELKDVYKKGKKAILVLVSKSGKTIETIANFGVLANVLKEIDKNWQEHIVVICDKNSKLNNFAQNKNFDVLNTPEIIKGRYSAFGPVGLFPLGLAGVKIEKLQDGAKIANEKCLLADVDKNPALSGAISIFLNYQAGRNIYNTFIFSSRLAFFGCWYSQLIAESLGKEGRGITPLISMGSNDLHSLLQLYLAGPKDKFTSFLSIKNLETDFEVPADLNLKDLVQGIEGKNLNQIMKAILEGTKIAYQKMKMPYVEFELENLKEETLGEFLQVKMIEAIYLAKLMGVDAFGQSAVELYKSETRRLLSE